MQLHKTVTLPKTSLRFVEEADCTRDKGETQTIESQGL